MGEVVIEARHGRGVGALLRAEDGRCPARAGERIVDVDGDAPRHGAGARVETGGVDGGESGESAAAGGDRLPGGVGEGGAEGRDDPGAAVGARRAADAQEDLVDAVVKHLGGDEADAVRAGAFGVEGDVGDLGEAVGLGGFDDRRPAIGGEAVAGGRRTAEGVDDVDGARRRSPHREEGLEGALAAVGEGQLGDRRGREGLPGPARERRRGRGCAGGALEGIGGADDRRSHSHIQPHRFSRHHCRWHRDRRRRCS